MKSSVQLEGKPKFSNWAILGVKISHKYFLKSTKKKKKRYFTEQLKYKIMEDAIMPHY